MIRAMEALRRGSRFFLGDNVPGRIGSPTFLKELRGLGLREKVELREARGGWTTVAGANRGREGGPCASESGSSSQEPAVAVLHLDPARHEFSQ
jgi:hypothetical protein